MHLFNLAEFSQQFGIDMTVSDFNSAVREASKAATRAVASRFRYIDFDGYTARRDVFNVRRTFDTGRNQNTILRLSRGFIDSTTGFTAYYTSNPVYVRNADANSYTSLQDVAGDGQSDYLFIDAKRGFLTVYNIDLTDQWVVVTYNCGLTAATDDEYEDVPTWLADAARAQAALLLKQNRAFNTEGEDDTDALRSQLHSLMQQHTRAHPSALLPTMSEPGA